MRKILRSKFAALASCGALAAVVAITAPGVASAQETVRVGLQSVPTDEVYKARDWGEPYDLTLDISSYSSASDSLKAFLANRVDIANGGAARLVTMAAQQPDEFYIVAVNQYGGERYGVMVPAGSEISDIGELRGKKIGAVTGSGTYSTFRVFLEQQGLSEQDFEIVNMKVEDLRAGVQSGIIDAAVAWEPHVAIAETMGSVDRLVSMEGVNESPNFVLVRRDFADANPEAVSKYIATLIDLGDFIASSAEEAGAMAAEQLSRTGVEVQPAALELALSRIHLNPEVTDELVAELIPIAESMLAAGNIPAMPDFEAVVNTEFFPRAQELAASRERM